MANKQIVIDVNNKIACLEDKEQFLVCGNNDYEVLFNFDSDWDGIEAKTAVFVYGDTPIHMPFVGNICEGVAVENATLCAIGVFAGNIKTTTGATIQCLTSIRDIGGVPKEPAPEVYDKIMEMLDEAIEAHTELPKGGLTGQVLKKQSDEDYDTAWEDDAYGQSVDLSEYQKKIDEGLGTESKEIVGAINELNAEKITLQDAKNNFVPKNEGASGFLPRYLFGTDYLGDVKRIPVGNFAEAFNDVNTPIVVYLPQSDDTPKDAPSNKTQSLHLWTADPIQPYHSATKHYVDNLILGIEEDLTAINEGGIE